MLIDKLTDAETEIRQGYAAIRRALADMRSIVTVPQALILLRIGDRDWSPSEMVASGIYTGTNISYNLRRLEQLGFIHRSDSDIDRRRRYFRLTTEGQKVVHAINQSLETAPA